MQMTAKFGPESTNIDLEEEIKFWMYKIETSTFESVGDTTLNSKDEKGTFESTDNT